jgi:hypothetical protein
MVNINKNHVDAALEQGSRDGASDKTGSTSDYRRLGRP